MHCYEVCGIKNSFTQSELNGLHGAEYMKVGKYCTTRRVLDHDSMSEIMFKVRPLFCVSRSQIPCIFTMTHCKYLTLKELSDNYEKEQMAKFFNCDPDEFIRNEDYERIIRNV